MFDQIRDTIRQFFTPARPLPAGTHHYQSPPDANQPYRLHLRMEPSGSGLLIINAKTVLHLNMTAAEYAYYLVKGVKPEAAADEMTRRYRVERSQALKDYQDLTDRIQSMVGSQDLDPVTYLDFDRRDPYTTDLSAPYRLDCSITYRVEDGDNPASAPIERADGELTTEQWKTVLQKAWDAGIPQVVFTGGEPTLRLDLSDLIAYTQQIGQVSGVLTNGLRFNDPSYLDSLLQAGLDHLMICLDPADEASWQAIQSVLGADIYTTVHLTITAENQAQVAAILDRLQAMHAYSLSLSASDPALQPVLQEAQASAAVHQIPLVWDLPVPYSRQNPVALEKDIAAPDGAGLAWLYVEPDGDVLPAQGINRVMGNLLRDPWEQIWAARNTA
jgi:organic radical activating enzyme